MNSSSLFYKSWRHSSAPTLENHQYTNSLHCSRLKHWAGLRCKARQLKRLLCSSKQKELTKTLHAMDGQTSASDITRQLRRFTGPTNPRKQRHQPLPLLKDPAGGICQYPAEALQVWIDFFMSMEGGRGMTHHALREQWLADLRSFAHSSLTIDIHELPTLDRP